VLSEDKVAVETKPRRRYDPKIEWYLAPLRGTSRTAQREYYMNEGSIYEPDDYKNAHELGLELDDRVDRKILKYINETKRSKYDAMIEKVREYIAERNKLQHQLKAGQIDEDTYDDLHAESWKKFEITKDQISKMLDCRQAMMTVRDFIVESVESKSNVFRDIKSIGRIVFSSVNGRMSANTFIYKITGYADCYLKSGIFSTKPGRRYFSAEVDYRTGGVIQFSWEPYQSLNVQEYRALPLPLPKFI
jgi:hypothetical protein